MSQLQVNRINDASGGVLAPISSVMRNRIINGAMVIDQRNAGASVTPLDGTYTLDRWAAGVSQTSKLTVQQNSTAPVGFVNSLLVTSSSAYSISSGDYFLLYQSIEGNNTADLGWGTANAKTVTLSFWVRSSLTGTFGGSLRNNGSTRSYPFSYTVSTANTFEQKTITITGDTSGTWLTTNGLGIRVSFGLGVGSDFSGTAGAWASANYASATGATSVVGTSGATFYITGVQLEVGTQATSFEYRQYGTELALCQRYFQTYGNGFLFSGRTNSTSSIVFGVPTNIPLRASPTITNGTMRAFYGSGFADSTATVTVSAFTANASGVILFEGSFPSIADDRAYNIGNQGAALTLSSEL
jgi:hypothetical protein